MATDTKTPTRKPEDDQSGFYRPSSEPVYDDQAPDSLEGLVSDKEVADARQTVQDSSGKQRSQTQSDLAQREGAAAESPEAAKSQGRDTTEELGAKEKAADSGEGDQGEKAWHGRSALYKGGGKKGKGKVGELSEFKEADSWVKRNKKKLMIAGAGGGAGVIITVIVGLLQFGPLLIPTLTENMGDNRFARVSRNIMVSTDTVVRLKLALDSTGDERYREALQRYQAGNTGADRLFNKVNSLRPRKLVEQLLLDVEFEYRTYTVPGTSVTRNRVVSATYRDGTVIPVPENQFNWGRQVIHPWKYISTLSDGWKARYSTLLSQAQRLDPGGGRFKTLAQRFAALRAGKYLQQTLSIERWRWSKAEVDEAEGRPSTRENAVNRATATSFDKATDDNSRPRQAAAGDSEAQRGVEETAECVHDPECQRQMRQTGDTVAPQTRSRLSTVFTPNAVQNVIRTVGTVADLGHILCLMHNVASPEVSRPIMKGNSAMAMATWASLAAAGDQQIYTAEHKGDQRVSASLTGGYNDQINADGSAVQSNTFREANGQAYDTGNTLSPQASASGTFATNPLSGILSSANIETLDRLDSLGFCSAVQNPWIAGGITAAELALYIVPGVNALKAAGTVTAKGVSTVVVRSFANAFKQQFSRQAIRGFGAVSTVANAAQLTSLIYQAVTYQRMGSLYNGAAQGAEYINQADAGAELAAQQTGAVTQASRPLTEQEYNNVEGLDDTFRTQTAQAQSFSDRYFAMDNPNSLLRRTGVAAYANLNASGLTNALRTLLQNAANIFNPGIIFSSFASVSAQDNGTVLSRDYGIVQRGWTEDELNAYMLNDSYAPLYNEIVLDESGRRDELMDKYGKCFSGDMADLLADRNIQRDSNASVLPNEGDCAPNKLGDSGPPDDGQLEFDNEEAELVFRLRISNRNNAAVDELLEVQDPTTDPVTGGSASGQVNSDGYAFPVEPGTMRDYATLPCNNTTCHHDGTAAFDLFFGSTGNMDGKDVYAISDGEIINRSQYHVPECYSIQFLSNDGNYYWYGHLQNPTVQSGDTVEAGDKIAEVARNSLGSDCRGGRDHLHIDRGCVVNGEPQTAGRKSCRDPSFVEFMNDMWRKLPPE